jgi:CRISPR-associated endonuclease/helicase Cas3
MDAAHRLLGEVLDHWQDGVSREKGLAAVLLQGTVTLSDHGDSPRKVDTSL